MLMMYLNVTFVLKSVDVNKINTRKEQNDPAKNGGFVRRLWKHKQPLRVVGLKEQCRKDHWGKGTELGGRQKKEQGTWERVLSSPTVKAGFCFSSVRIHWQNNLGLLSNGPDYCTTKLNILAKWFIISSMSRDFVWGPVMPFLIWKSRWLIQLQFKGFWERSLIFK